MNVRYGQPFAFSCYLRCLCNYQETCKQLTALHEVLCTKWVACREICDPICSCHIKPPHYRPCAHVLVLSELNDGTCFDVIVAHSFDEMLGHDVVHV